MESMKEDSLRKEYSQFSFMGIGSLIYAVFYTFCLYKNSSGITYPFFVGGTCLFFFFYLKNSGITAKKFSLFLTISLILLGLSTCLTDSYLLIFYNKLGIFFLFFFMVLHNLYEDKNWDLPKYLASIINIICTSLLYIFWPFTDLFAFFTSKRKTEQKADGKGKYVLLGLLISLPLLIVILILLSSADAVFYDFLYHIFYFNIDLNEDILGICFLSLFAFIASYSIMCRLSFRSLKEEVPDKKNAEPIVGITFTGIISFVYLIFCFIQIVYLFGGWGTLPQSHTYASYARSGFFQLVFVCLINLALVLTCIKLFRNNKVLKGILTFISTCTYIMIASSAYRMLLYIQVYYLTFLRVFVLWALFVIFLLITGILIMIYHETFPLTKYCVITVTVLYLVFSFSHPDYWIAKYNLSHSIYQTATTDDNGFDDFCYLYHLSYDAAPAIFENAQKLDYEEENGFSKYIKKTPEKMSIRKWNLSRWTAFKLYSNYASSHLTH